MTATNSTATTTKNITASPAVDPAQVLLQNTMNQLKDLVMVENHPVADTERPVEVLNTDTTEPADGWEIVAGKSSPVCEVICSPDTFNGVEDEHETYSNISDGSLRILSDTDEDRPAYSPLTDEEDMYTTPTQEIPAAPTPRTRFPAYQITSSTCMIQEASGTPATEEQLPLQLTMTRIVNTAKLRPRKISSEFQQLQGNLRSCFDSSSESDDEIGPRGGNNDQTIPLQGINVEQFLGQFGIATPESLAGHRIIHTTSGQRRSDCLFFSLLRFLWAPYTNERIREERNDLRDHILRNMENVYPEGYFPIGVKTGCSHNEIIINNSGEMVAFLNSDKYYHMYISDPEIAAYSRLKNLQIQK